jgi:hypothetical protein
MDSFCPVNRRFRKKSRGTRVPHRLPIVILFPHKDIPLYSRQWFSRRSALACFAGGVIAIFLFARQSRGRARAGGVMDCRHDG